MRLHYYNPEVDLAMAMDKPTYTAPHAISAMQIRNALLPALYAQQGEMILLPEGVDNECASTSLYSHIAEKKKLKLLTWDKLAELDFTDIEIVPWGWCRALRHKLIKHGVPENAIPSQEQLDRLRDLCHRRMTIMANNHQACDMLKYRMPPCPIEFSNVESAMQWADIKEDVFFKAPWSSSGHGIFHLSKTETPPEYFDSRKRLAKEWLNGTIGRQGSVLAETGINRILDCATEWTISRDREVRFVGLSVFQADSNGHYLGNLKLPQSQLKQLIIESLCQSDSELSQVQGDILLDVIIDIQKEVLSDLIAPYYCGPLGIDMIIGESCIIAPFVEFNLRMTQGMVLALSEQH